MPDPHVIELPIRQIVKCFLLRGESGVVLVDAGPHAKEHILLERIADAGVRPEEIDLIVVTHCHKDHIWGLSTLLERTGARVAAHNEAVPYIREGRQPELKSTGLLARILKLFIQMSSVAKLPEVEPGVFVQDSMDLRNFGVAAEVIHTPGHTPGSVSLITDGGEAIVGDLIMGLPNPNTPRLPLWADDLDQVKESIRKVLAFDPTTIHCGHGGPFEADAVQALVSQ